MSRYDLTYFEWRVIEPLVCGVHLHRYRYVSGDEKLLPILWLDEAGYDWELVNVAS